MSEKSSNSNGRLLGAWGYGAPSIQADHASSSADSARSSSSSRDLTASAQNNLQRQQAVATTAEGESKKEQQNRFFRPSIFYGRRAISYDQVHREFLAFLSSVSKHIASRLPTLEGATKIKQRATLMETYLEAYPKLASLELAGNHSDVPRYPLHDVCLCNLFELDFIRTVYTSYPEAATVRFNGLLPFHMAIISEAKTTVVGYLATLNYAVQEPLQGLLPLHYVIAMGVRLDIVSTLVRAWPEAMDIPLANGLSAFELMARDLFTNVGLARILAQHVPHRISHRGLGGRNILHSALASRSRMEPPSVLLDKNEQVVRIFIDACPDCVRGCMDDSAISVLEYMLQIPHTTEMVEHAVSLYPAALSDREGMLAFAMMTPGVNMQVKEMLVRRFPDPLLMVIIPPCELATAELFSMVLRVATLNPSVSAIAIGVQGEGLGIDFSPVIQYAEELELSKPLILWMQDHHAIPQSVAVNQFLRTNTSLATLVLDGGIHGSALEGMAVNSDLDVLRVRSSSAGCLVTLAKSMQRNQSVTLLEIETNSISDVEARALSEMLKYNRCVKMFRLVSASSPCKVSENGMSMFLDVMASTNTTLLEFNLDERLQFYCNLNAAGRSHIRNVAIRRRTFIHILASCDQSMDVIFGLLTDVPHVWSTDS
jgi:hypothetical protein